MQGCGHALMQPRVVCAAQAASLVVKSNLGDYDSRISAVGQLIRGLESSMKELPLRMFMVGVALGETSVEAVWAVQHRPGELSMYHRGPLPFHLSEQSEGLGVFLQVVTAPPDKAGFVEVPPEVTALR